MDDHKLDHASESEKPTIYTKEGSDGSEISDPEDGQITFKTVMAIIVSLIPGS
jgi:hypothetical protein